MSKSQTIKDILQGVYVMPVVTISDLKAVIPLIKALVAGGIKAIEITLRTPEAWQALTLAKESFPNLYVGAGTIKSSADISRAESLGLDFILSPGTTEKLLATACDLHMPYLPGVATASEILLAESYGYDILKLFPTGLLGGVALLKTFAAVFPALQFSPAGGVDTTNMKDYLSLSNVVCVGGNFAAPTNLIQQHNWDAIRLHAEKCLNEAKSIKSHITIGAP